MISAAKKNNVALIFTKYFEKNLNRMLETAYCKKNITKRVYMLV